MSTELRLDEPGTLHRPGIIGRIVRLLLAALCLYALWDVLGEGGDFLDSTSISRARDSGVTINVGALVPIAIAFWLFPYVVNIGFSKGWRRRPQVAVIVLLLVAIAVSGATSGDLLGPPVAWVLFVWLVYVFGHLGVSFALSAVLATPGCEMRALPHLWTLVTGRVAKEHYCPGVLDRIDKWEARRE